MTLAITFCSWILIPHSNRPPRRMEKRIKLSKTSPDSLSIEVRGPPSRWNRSGSFSSCSDDSAIYCNNFAVGKHLSNDNQSPLLGKRSRHSSGSSASSNTSCLSDKNGHKPSRTLPSSVANRSLGSSIRNEELICSDTNSRSMEFNHKTIMHERIPCNNESESPFRHNLRRNIRKKTCSCDCNTTCATLVVRRFHKIRENKVESKTLISKTKINSFLPNNSRNSSQQTSKAEVGRKRRSEVEKLYASLHEIEWAKNFSPDNILTQFNIRQAASCSAFGRSSNRSNNDKSENEKHTPMKSSSLRKQTVSCKTFKKFNSDFREDKYSREPSGKYSNSPKRETKSDKIEMFSISTNFHQYEKIETSLKHEPGEDVDSQKAQVTSYTETSSECSAETKGVESAESTNSVEDDAMSCNSETSSVLFDGTSGPLGSDFLGFDEGCRSNPELLQSESEVEYSLIPSFFDLAEQGIRTVDACVRELGAEVVVSTCCDDTHDLPLLSAIKESETFESSTSDTPPVLEPYTDVGSSPIHRMRTRAVTSKLLQNSSTEHIQSRPDERDQKRQMCFYKRKLRTKHFTKRNHLASNVVKGKQIFNKYSKYVHNRQKLKKMPLAVKNNFEVSENLSGRTPCNSAVKPVNQKEDLMSMATQPLTFERSELLYQTDSESKQTIVKSVNRNFSIYSYSHKLMLDYVEKDTTLVGRQNEVAGCSSTTLSLAQTVQHSAQAIALPKEEGDPNNNIQKGRRDVVKFTPSNFVGFTTHYKSLIVTKNADYTQVMLKYTRSNAILFTLEGLNELTEVVTRVASDPSCNVMIIQGMADCFCMGLDLKPLLGPERFRVSSELALAIKKMIEALSGLRKPLVAVINGPAYGLGMTLLHHADVKIANASALFCMPHSMLGYIPEGGASLTLPQVVGPTVAMDLVMRGHTLTAIEARNVGLISEVLEGRLLPYDLVDRVRSLAQNSLSAMETTKAMIRMSLHVNLPLVLENEAKLLPRMWLTQPCQDAMRGALDSGFLPFD